MLFREIGFKASEVGKAKRSVQTDDAALKAKAVLRKWKKNEGKRATRKALLEALAECQGKLTKLLKYDCKENREKMPHV